jgi:DNA-binding NtrC family response regulator
MDQLRVAMLQSLEVLYSAQGLFELKPDITRVDFARFVTRALERLPELHALEWIPRVPGPERASCEASAVAAGLDGFVFREIDPRGRLIRAAARDEYWPVLYAEPAAINSAVLGLDLRSDPCRRAALERAIVTGHPTATSPLRLAQLGQHRLGFLVVMAVRGAGDIHVGWVLAVFRLQALVSRIFAPLIRSGISVEIRDLGDPATAAFAVGMPPEPGSLPAWRHVQDMPIAGRDWRFVFAPGPEFSAEDPGWLRQATATLQRANELLEQRVAARTAALEQANAELRAEAARREAAEQALARADAQLSFLTEAEARQWALAGLVGRSARFGQLLREVRAVQAAARTTVLLTGESGTGKELLARAIHYGGPHANGPFVRVDCCSLPSDLEQAEALIFGATRGAGPRGESSRRGFCELAEGGTLFFDEIGDLPLALQARVLRVLEDGAYLPVGADQPRTLHARVLAATHAALPAQIAAGRFRQDLYYRLGHYHLSVPALRERMDDVPALAQHFVRKLSAELKRAAPKLSPAALQRLLSHPYPGNIRELKNTLERAIIYAGGDQVGGEHILFAPPPVGVSGANPPMLQPMEPVSSASSGCFLGDLPLNLSAAEDILIARALAVAEGNMSRAARLLGINRASLYRWQERRQAVGAA